MPLSSIVRMQLMDPRGRAVWSMDLVSKKGTIELRSDSGCRREVTD